MFMGSWEVILISVMLHDVCKQLYDFPQDFHVCLHHSPLRSQTLAHCSCVSAGYNKAGNDDIYNNNLPMLTVLLMLLLPVMRGVYSKISIFTFTAAQVL